MPTKTIYVPDEALQVFDKAKELAGESLSSIVIEALNDFILKKELEEKCMETFERWVGIEDYCLKVVNGKRIKFYGKKLSDARQDGIKPETAYKFELFYTRKGQFLLYYIETYTADGNSVFSYKTYKSLKEIIDTFDVPSKLIFDAEKEMPGVLCEELDV